MRLYRSGVLGIALGCGVSGCDIIDNIIDAVEEVQSAQDACSEEAWRGNIFRVGVLDDTAELNGTFDDLVFDADTQSFEMKLWYRQLGHDTTGGVSTDCDYQGTAYGAIAGFEDETFRYEGLAVVQSLHPDREGCLAEPQEIEISLDVPTSCTAVSGGWVHDAEDSLGTGEGTLQATARYPLSEVSDEDWPEASGDEESGDEEPLFTPEGCPIGEEMTFSGPLSAVNGCSATLNTTISVGVDGDVLGDMWLTEEQGNCDLVEGEIVAQLADGQILGQIQGVVEANAGVTVIEECTQMIDGWFQIDEWGDEEIATFSLARVE